MWLVKQIIFHHQMFNIQELTCIYRHISPSCISGFNGNHLFYIFVIDAFRLCEIQRRSRLIKCMEWISEK